MCVRKKVQVSFSIFFLGSSVFCLFSCFFRLKKKQKKKGHVLEETEMLAVISYSFKKLIICNLYKA